VPLYPGVYSALGLLMSDVKHDYVQSRMAPIATVSPDDVNVMFDRLEAQAVDGLARDGFHHEQIRVQRALDMRYAGQGYEITIACRPPSLPSHACEGEQGGAVHAATLQALRARFDDQHQAMFGHRAPEEPVEIVSYRVRGIGIVPHVEMPKFSATGTPLADALRETRRVRFDGAEVACPVYQRERIDVDLAIAGPAILDQFDCTTVIGPGQVARVDEWKNLIVTEA
jgi:N-methylhydantoinase A